MSLKYLFQSLSYSQLGPQAGQKLSRRVVASRSLSDLNRLGHMCTTPFPRHQWLAGCGARSGPKSCEHNSQSIVTKITE
ncbi:unnamed protein product [Spirodela intermedia]|uniref:Uncharacterized protein n=1 Tax=Spirodela intermedia TaxID=51605 RepID=A0A7I8JAL5_SPIIN|nr:unnamed protein product [Spirodela intermedia]CAA6667258.1 unnamed protein product [Spirodela intermedia]